MEIVSYYFKIVCFLVLLFEKTHSISDLRFCGNEDCTGESQHFTKLSIHIRKAV